MDSLSKIGIDLWGMLLYLVNYGLLLGLLGYFFYPKIMKAIDERRRTIKKNIEETAHLQKVLEIQIANHQKEKEEMHANLERQAAELKKELQDKRTEMVQEMEAERERMILATKTQLDKEKKEIIKAAEQEVLSIMKKVLIQVVTTKVPESAVSESVSEAWKQYANH